MKKEHIEFIKGICILIFLILFMIVLILHALAPIYSSHLLFDK